MAFSVFKMLYLFALFLVLAAEWSSAEKIPLHCFAPCPFGLTPICTTNGTAYKLFTNKCVLDTENCIENTDWRPVNDSFCSEKNKKPLDTCKRSCDNHPAPHCATDGNIFEIFWNKCFRRERKCLDGKKWEKVPLEKCMQDKVCADVCPNHSNYVCASNGQKSGWFQNSCFMELENCRLKDSAKPWKVVENCQCMVKSATILRNICEIKCKPIYDPVCGIDGTKKKTFVNVCQLTTHNCLNCSKFTVLHAKAC